MAPEDVAGKEQACMTCMLWLQVLTNGNVYGAMPPSPVRSLSICLMLIHQVRHIRM